VTVLLSRLLFLSLLYRTNAGYIRFLRQRGYELSNRSNVDYWNSLYNGLKQVENHLTQIEMIRAKMENVGTDAKQEGNPYDSIMAWIASNEIHVDENITVARYIEVKKIIQNRIKAKKKNLVHG